MPSNTPSGLPASGLSATGSGTTLEEDILATRKMAPGGENYRAYVGPPQQYDFMGATQFRLVTSLGLREDHHLVDIGCGSLRAGRLLLQYLMPGRYTGIEPNSWLWQTAVAQEIGQDVLDIKAPRFFDESDLSLAGVADHSSDFIVAQSIYSHVGLDLLQSSLAAASRCLSQQGQFLFTAILADCAGAANKTKGSAYSGWLYPECTLFEEDAITEACQQSGLHVQKLSWYHPRQVWFRAVRDPDMCLTTHMVQQLGTGRPLFDTRFK